MALPLLFYFWRSIAAATLPMTADIRRRMRARRRRRAPGKTESRANARTHLHSDEKEANIFIISRGCATQIF